MDEKQGIANAVEQLKSKLSLTDDDLEEILGDSVLEAMKQNNYAYITIADMQKLADEIGLIFIMNFQTLDKYLTGSEELKS